MKDLGKKNVVGILIDAVDYDAAVLRIIAAAKDGRAYGVSALASHGVMTGVKDPDHKQRLNRLDLVTPDGQPVRWALNLLHGTRLRERVYGPELTLRVCRAAAAESLPVYFYGSRQEVVDRLGPRLRESIPGLVMAGAEPSKFRTVAPEEQTAILARIRASGARLVFVGLGCPRQEVFAFENRGALSMPTIAVGAAFDYHAGLLDEPPAFFQRYGLQWAYRFAQEPRRLWHRYIVLGSQYMGLLLAQKLRLWRPDPARPEREPPRLGYA